MMNRRQMLKLMGGSTVLMTLASCGGNGQRNEQALDEPDAESEAESEPDGSTGALLRSAVKMPQPFTLPLPIPPVLQATHSDATTDYYEMTQMSAQVSLIPGLMTEIWGYNGIFPGPTVVSRRGRQVSVQHRNELPVPTVVHLHGGRTAPEYDGYPTDFLMPTAGGPMQHGEHMSRGNVKEGVREYVYALDQPAATLWYHDHRMDFTGPQVYRGLAGFHILHDELEEALPLPHGERDIPLMICDRAFNGDGSFKYPSIDPTLQGEAGVTKDSMAGVLGDINLVNGAIWPYLEVSNTRYRFRLLNAANARRYRLVLDPPPNDGPSFVQVGSDQGLLAQPVSHKRIEIAPAERMDIVIDFSAYPVGTQVTLLNAFVDAPLDALMRFHVVRSESDDSAVPSKLTEVEPLTRAMASVTRQFNFSQTLIENRMMWTINGKPFDVDRMDAQPQLGSTEIWKLSTNVHHPVHLHLAHFQVLTRGGGSPGDYDAGWKDTIDMRGGEEAEIIARFVGYKGRYVFHCHNLEHEDMMMMANLEIV